VHSAKGLEWGVVLIIWVMDGYFPLCQGQFKYGVYRRGAPADVRGSHKGQGQSHPLLSRSGASRSWVREGGSQKSLQRGVSSLIQALPRGVIEWATAGTPLRENIASPQMEKGVGIEKGMTGSMPCGQATGSSTRLLAKGSSRKFSSRRKWRCCSRNFGRKLLHLGYTSLEKI